MEETKEQKNTSWFKRHKYLCVTSGFIILVIVGLLIIFNPNQSKQWEEEVLLGNGAIVWVDRTANYMKTNFGQEGQLRIEALTLSVRPNEVALSPPIWKEAAVPVLLDYDEEMGGWYVVATYIMSSTWHEWGRPEIPYRKYIVENGKWVVAPLNISLLGRRTNLFSGFMREKLSRITIEDKPDLEKNSAEKFRVIISH